MLGLELLNDKAFFDIYYRKKPILQNELDEFLKALKDYRAALCNNINENEEGIVANALKPFFAALGFDCKVKHKLEGRSEIDLALFANQSYL